MTDLANFGFFCIEGRSVNVDKILLCTKSQFAMLNLRQPTKSELYRHLSLVNNGSLIKE